MPGLKKASLAAALVPCVLTILFSGCGSGAAVSATSNPLVAEYTVHPALPGVVTVEFGENTDYGQSTSPVHTTVGPVTVQVAGMKANTTYHMRARTDYDDGSSATDIDRTFTTGAIPKGILPPFTVTATSGLTPQPGVELVNTLQGNAGISTVFATDIAGNVVWYYPFSDFAPGLSLYPVKQLPNGHFMAEIAVLSNAPVLPGGIPPGSLNEFREFDLAGNTIRSLTMSDLNAKLAAAGFNVTLQLFSHDFLVLPNGHFLVLTNTLRSFTNLVGLPGVTNVLGDVVVDLDPDFNPVWVWNEFDHFDVNRHPMNFPDWTHSNALAYSPDDGNFLISIRHQNWIVKVDYRDGGGTGNVLWRLGQGGDFTLQGALDPTDWFYAQHDVNFISSNTTGSFKLAIMDNGDDRISPSTAPCNGTSPCHYTTIPVMQVDENAKTASFLFHQILPLNLYSSFAGSTRILANANIEYNLAGLANTNAQTFEVTPTATPQTVWQMQLPGENTYRSYRVPSLYPGVQW